MSWKGKHSRLLFVGTLLVAGLGPIAPVLASTPGSPANASGVQLLTGTLADGATYKIEVPAHWNHTLFLYSHGYKLPGSNNPATDDGDTITGNWMLDHGYALAGSSFSQNGYSIAQAVPDQISTLDVFGKLVGHPTRTIAWGHSQGGTITAALVQLYPKRFTAALPMCGVLSGGTGEWNLELNSAFTVKTLIDPALPVTNITDPGTAFNDYKTAEQNAQATPQGQARMALAAAMGDTPGWSVSLTPEPAKTDYVSQEAAQYDWIFNLDTLFGTFAISELEQRTGGNPTWNTGVDYFRQFALSVDNQEVQALYKKAGLSLHKDLETLNNAPRVKGDPAAVAYLQKYITFNGDLDIPVLTMHTTGDGLVVNQNEQAYRSVVDKAGDANMLRQVFVHRAGHCAFTPAETVTAVQTLIHRINTGRWDTEALEPSRMNETASDLGPTVNVFDNSGVQTPTPPAFLHYNPAPYLRPADMPDHGRR